MKRPLLAATAPSWFEVTRETASGVEGLARFPRTRWADRGLAVTGRGSRPVVRETVPGADLPLWCLERHIFGEAEFCLGLNTLPIRSSLAAQRWWDQLAQFIVCQPPGTVTGPNSHRRRSLPAQRGSDRNPVRMSIEIHPSAIVDPRARIGAGSRIGPYCVIGPHVTLGSGNTLLGHVALAGRMELGSGNQLFPFCSLGTSPQLAKSDAAGILRIGDRNVFREGTTAQGGLETNGMTSIGNGNSLLTNSHVGHDVTIGNEVVVSNGCAIAGHVTIEDGAYVSGLVGIHQWVRIGSLSFVAAGSMVAGSVLPFCLVAGDRARLRGHNAVGLKRAGWSEVDVLAVKKAVRGLRYGRLSSADVAESKDVDFVTTRWATFAKQLSRPLVSANASLPMRFS